MLKILSAILNTPWSTLGLLLSMLSFPREFKIDRRGVIIIDVKRLWVSELFLWRRVRGFTLGNVILLSEVAESSTLDHEMVHVKQFIEVPMVFPVLYIIECFKNGYLKNKYEQIS